MKPRKLLTPKALIELQQKTEMGVPLALALRQANLDITRPTAFNLLRMLHIANNPISPPSVTDSLFPAWLDKDGPAVQEQPQSWIYEGYFPLGSWHAVN